MKKFIGILVLILIIIVVVVLLRSGAPEDIERGTIEDVATTTDSEANEDDKPQSELLTKSAKINASIDEFKFTGYGPGKEHEGTFEDFRVEDVVIEDGSAVAGKIIFDASSVKTDSEGLDGHLCSDDFFDCATYPEVVFELVNVNDGANEDSFVVTGNLMFHGVTKQVSFTVTKNGEKYSADFALDTTPFQFKYVGIDKDVRIQFTGTINIPE